MHEVDHDKRSSSAVARVSAGSGQATRTKWAQETFEFEYYPQNTAKSKASVEPVKKVFQQWLKEDSQCLTDGSAEELEEKLLLHLRLRADSKIYLLRGDAHYLFHGLYPGLYKVFVVQPSVDVFSSIESVSGALVLCRAVLTAKKEGDSVKAEWQLILTITPPQGFWQDSITLELIKDPKFTQLEDFSPLNEERTLVVTNTNGFQAQLSGQAKLSPTPAQLTGTLTYSHQTSVQEALKSWSTAVRLKDGACTWNVALTRDARKVPYNDVQVVVSFGGTCKNILRASD